MRTLNLKQTSIKEITEHWGFAPAGDKYHYSHLFIRCNRNGDINWDKASIYTLSEVEKKSLECNVNVIKA